MKRRWCARVVRACVLKRCAPHSSPPMGMRERVVGVVVCVCVVWCGAVRSRAPRSPRTACVIMPCVHVWCDVAPNAQDEKYALLRSYPDIAGKAALAKHVTAESNKEHSSAGLYSLTQEELDRFNALNAAYKEKFGKTHVCT